MENKMVKYFYQITTLNLDEIKALEEGMIVTHLKKNTFLIKAKKKVKQKFLLTIYTDFPMAFPRVKTALFGLATPPNAMMQKTKYTLNPA
jgi:hypothetical protein